MPNDSPFSRSRKIFLIGLKMYLLWSIRLYYFFLILGRRRESFWSTLVLLASRRWVVVSRYIMLTADEKSGAIGGFDLPVYVDLTASVLTCMWREFLSTVRKIFHSDYPNILVRLKLWSFRDPYCAWSVLDRPFPSVILLMLQCGTVICTIFNCIYLYITFLCFKKKSYWN